VKADVLTAARFLVTSAAIAALASCGGGGGGGGGPSVPTMPVALTSTNAQSVASGATLAGLNTSGSTSLFLPAANVQSNALPKTHILSRFMVQEIGRVNTYLQSPSAILAAALSTVNCIGPNGGTITINATSSTFVSETFNACSIAAGLTINGSITISNIVAPDANNFSASVSVSLTFSFPGTSFPDESFTGSFSVSEAISGTVTTIALSGTEIFTHEGTLTERLGSFSFTSSIDSTTSVETDTVVFNYASTAIGGSVSVTNPTPFQTSATSSFPNTGVLVITGAMGSTITVTVNGDENGATPQVTIVLKDGMGNVVDTLNVNWNVLG
jgi:hypothetical protein